MRPVTRKPLKLVAVISGLIVGCQQQTVSPVVRAANGFLENVGTINEWRCLKEVASVNELNRPLVDWKVNAIRERIDGDDPDATYYEVRAELTTLTKNDFTVTNTWILSVWESEELFEQQKRSTAEILEFEEEARKLIGKSDTELPNITPKRTDITEKPYCVTKRMSCRTFVC